jgi:hypothetical protein
MHRSMAKTVGITALVMCAAWAPARAAEPAKQTPFSINEPFEVPGMMLEPGRYLFKLIEAEQHRNVLEVFETVQLWAGDGTRVLTTLLTMPNYDQPTTDKTVFSFFERGPKQPKALRIWFAPGRSYGQEFVYPKAQAVELAKSVGRAVLSMPPELPGDIGRLARMVAEPAPASAKAPLVPAMPESRPASPAPAPNNAPPASPIPPISVTNPVPGPELKQAPHPRDTFREVARTQTQSRAREAETKAASLPKTASYLAMLTVLGLLGIGGGALLRILALRLER